MPQFGVYRIGQSRLVVDVQSDLVATGSRMVAPLFPLESGPRPIRRLEPVVIVDGIPHVVHMAEMAAIPEGLVRGEPVADLTAQADEMKAAIDLVFFGF